MFNCRSLFFSFFALSLFICLGCELPSLGPNGTQNISVQLVDNHGVPLVSDDLRVSAPNLTIVPTDDNGNFTIPSVSTGTTISGYIQDLVVPTGESRLYVTAIRNGGAMTNSFGSINDPNFGFNTVVQNNKIVITYPRVIHDECAYPSNYTGPVFSFAGPLITTEHIAQAFTLSAQENVCKVGMRAMFEGFNSTGPSGPFQIYIRIRSDNGGTPGAILAQKSSGNNVIGAGPTATAVGQDSSGQGIYMTAQFTDFCSNGASPVSLNASQRYWIEMGLDGVSFSYNPQFDIEDGSCPFPSGGAPMQKSSDGVNWAPVTLVHGSQATSIFLSE